MLSLILDSILNNFLTLLLYRSPRVNLKCYTHTYKRDGVYSSDARNRTPGQFAVTVTVTVAVAVTIAVAVAVTVNRSADRP